MEDYFELTDKGIKIKDESIMLVSCFNDLYKRDTTTDKAVVFKELHYIWQMSDVRSSSLKRGLKGKALVKDATSKAKLDTTWKADDLVNECVLYYREDRSNIVIVTYENLLATFGTANESIEFLDDVLRHKLSTIRDNKDAVDEHGNSVLDSDSVKLIISSLRELLSLGTEIPKVVKVLEQTKDTALSMNKSSGIGRGDIKITDSMEPDNSVLSR